MGDILKCHYCGRFVRYEGLKTGEVDSKEVWSSWPPGVDHVRYWHVECAKKEGAE